MEVFAHSVRCGVVSRVREEEKGIKCVPGTLAGGVPRERINTVKVVIAVDRMANDHQNGDKERGKTDFKDSGNLK